MSGGPSALTRSRLVLYGLPALAFAVPTIPVYVYLPSFYAEDLGLGLGITGVILLAVRMLDVVSDPLAGLLSDRVHTRFGRRKPWIAAGGLAAGLALFMLFAPPDGVSAVYLGLWATVLYVGWTFMAVPYNAWGAELSDDYDGRTRVTTMREGFSVVGILLAASLPVALGLLGWAKPAQLVGVALVTIILGAIAMTLALRFVPEVQANQDKSPLTPSALIRSFRDNAPFRNLLSAWFVNGLANGLPAVLLPLFLTHWLEVGTNESGALIFVYFAAAVAALPLWSWASRKTSKNHAWCYAMLAAVAAFVWVPLTGAGDVLLFGLICVITGASLGADLALPPAMQADVIDVDRASTGQEQAGLYFALWSMAQKLALAAAVGIAFPLLEWTGLEDGRDAGLMTLVALYAGLPVVLKIAACVLVWRHPLNREQQADLRRSLDLNSKEQEI